MSARWMVVHLAFGNWSDSDERKEEAVRVEGGMYR